MKKSLVLSLFLAILLPTNAQLLWEISGNGASQKSYVFGTHHLVPVSFLDSVPNIYKCFNRTQVVVGEFVMSELNVAEKIQAAATLPEKYSYHELYSDSDYQFVSNELKEVLQLSLNELGRLKPAMIQNLFLVTYHQKLFPNADNSMLDSYFQRVADEQGKKVVGLETVDDQIHLLFESQSIERQAFLLLGTIKEKDKTEQELTKLNRFYKTGNLEKLLIDFQNDTTEFSPTEIEKYLLLDNRNLQWVSNLSPLLKQNSCFVAVGAMHLVGENGLINLLRKEGFRVKKVK